MVGRNIIAVLELTFLAMFATVLEAQQPSGRPDIVIDDFERDNYAPWVAEGEAFGPGPAQGTLPHQMPVTGYHGRRLVNSYFKGDRTVGTLTSPPFVIQRHYIVFLIGGGGFPEETFIELLVDGKRVRHATGPNTRPGGSEELDWAVWDVREFEGKRAVLRIVDRRTGGWGHINVDYIVQTDSPPAFITEPLQTVVRHRFLLLPVADSGPNVYCQISHDEKVIRYFNIQLAESDKDTLYWAPIDVQRFVGKTLTWHVRPRSATALLAERIQQADSPRWPEKLYQEGRRPQFHFSPRVGWTNDPNGLVYFDGEYHLFFQHNPFGIRWGNMTWGHAVSRDLIHWQELGDAILPDERGTIFSGSAVADLNNSSGLGTKENPPLCAFYTAAGRHSYVPCPFTQCMAYSLDRGRTWTKFAGNPVVGHIAGSNRDPKVFWHEATKRWIMVLYVRRDAFSIFSSPDLKQWKFESEAEFPTAHECPELFELPVEGRPGVTRWVLWTASGNHLIGHFDGHRFRADSNVLRSEWGRNSYAGQTWNNVPDGRRIFIAWMRSDGSAYRGMPFNQQMTIPREFSLRETEDGLRLYAWPVRELDTLRRRSRSFTNVVLDSNSPSRSWTTGELLDVELAVTPIGAEIVQMNLRGVSIAYNVRQGTLECLGSRVDEIKPGSKLKLRCLVDRTSLEIFAQGGRYVMSFCYPFERDNKKLEITTQGGNATIESLAIHELESIWK